MGLPATSPRARLPSSFADQHIRYVLYRSYVLLAAPQIEPITEQVADQIPLGKAQRLHREAYESPALPLSYSANEIKLIERDPQRQPPTQEHMNVAQHITFGVQVEAGCFHEGKVLGRKLPVHPRGALPRSRRSGRPDRPTFDRVPLDVEFVVDILALGGPRSTSSLSRSRSWVRPPDGR